MSILVVGSIAFDSVKTLYGSKSMQLGGAANYFSLAARFFSPVQMVGVVGEDFPLSHLDFLAKNGVDVSGVQVQKGKSFHWQGEYGENVNEARTIATELNVFANFYPYLPPNFKETETVFLANIDPDIQIHVLNQMKKPKITALDSMNFWINNKRESLLKVVSMIDLLFMNEAEIKLFTGENNIFKALKAVHQMGVKVGVIKRGEYGSLLSYEGQLAFIPAYPVEDVVDPTGAGDSFAGGFLGNFSLLGEFTLDNLKKSLIMGSVISSFVVEKFSLSGLLEIDSSTINDRRDKLIKLSFIS